MNRVPLCVLIVTILTIICTITYVVTMYRGIDMIPEVVEKCKPEMADKFAEAPNFKQAMVFMSILALVLAITHLVFSIMAESGHKYFIVRTPCMLALIILTILLQLAFIVSVGILAMTAALMDAIVSQDPNLHGLVPRAMDPSYNGCGEAAEDDDGEEGGEGTRADEVSRSRAGQKPPQAYGRRTYRPLRPGGRKFFPQVNLLKLDGQVGHNWLDDDDYQDADSGRDRVATSDYNDYRYLPAYRAALYTNIGGNTTRWSGSERTPADPVVRYRSRRGKGVGAFAARGVRTDDDPESGEEGGEGNDTAEEFNPCRSYALLVTALVMNIFIVMLLTFYTIIRATNLATAVCNECCVPMEC